MAYKLRRDPRVEVLERTDALHLRLPEPIGLVTVDTGWTRQARILPAALGLLADDGRIITLVKPHYEAEQEDLRGGVLPDELTQRVLEPIRARLAELGLRIVDETESPIRGRGGNREFLWHLEWIRPDKLTRECGG